MPLMPLTIGVVFEHTRRNDTSDRFYLFMIKFYLVYNPQW